ncbi:MAG: hypothetical protein SNJ64_02495 [Endomicrobiia bacterium]
MKDLKIIKKITVDENFKVPIFAVGAELKSTFAIGYKNEIFVLENKIIEDEVKMLKTFKKNYDILINKIGIKPKIVVYDMHPNYLSTKFAQEVAKKSNLQTISVQHHYAHMVSCMLENKIKQNCVGIIFDGTGYGTDGKIWGSEFLVGDRSGKFTRAGHFDYIDLVSGDLGIKEPYRNVIAFLYKNFSTFNLSLKFLDKFKNKFKDYKDRFEGIKYLVNDNRVIKTCGMGRLFDVVAVLCGIGFVNNFEGELPIGLEKIAVTRIDEVVQKNRLYDYKLIIGKDGNYLIDTNSLLNKIVKDLEYEIPEPEVAAKFHYTICKISLDIVKKICKRYKINKIILSGGVFQNKIVTRILTEMLKKTKYEVYFHKQFSCNDSGVSLGQVVLGNNYSR